MVELAVPQAISPAFLHRECPEVLSYATRKLSIPNDCILSITVFHMAMVLTQRRRETRR